VCCILLNFDHCLTRLCSFILHNFQSGKPGLCDYKPSRCRDKQENQREVQSHWLQEWSNPNWAAMENILRAHSFCFLVGIGQNIRHFLLLFVCSDFSTKVCTLIIDSVDYWSMNSVNLSLPKHFQVLYSKNLQQFPAMFLCLMRAIFFSLMNMYVF
jgi:hypothetical protein